MTPHVLEMLPTSSRRWWSTVSSSHPNSWISLLSFSNCASFHPVQGLLYSESEASQNWRGSRQSASRPDNLAQPPHAGGIVVWTPAENAGEFCRQHGTARISIIGKAVKICRQLLLSLRLNAASSDVFASASHFEQVLRHGRRYLLKRLNMNKPGPDLTDSRLLRLSTAQLQHLRSGYGTVGQLQNESSRVPQLQALVLPLGKTPSNMLPNCGFPSDWELHGLQEGNGGIPATKAACAQALPGCMSAQSRHKRSLLTRLHAGEFVSADGKNPQPC